MSKTKKLGILAGSVVLVAVFVIIIATRKTEIPLTDYVSVSFDGYEGYGAATVAIDEVFLREIASAVHAKDVDGFVDAIRIRDEEGLERAADRRGLDADDLIELVDEIYESVQPDKDSDLKNGDKVSVRFAFDNDDAAEFGIRFTGESKTVTVEGLEPLKEVNPFDYLSVSFSGISPAGSIHIEKKTSSEEVMRAVSFRVEKIAEQSEKATLSEVQQGDTVTMQGVKLGDTLTVTAHTDESEKKLREIYGCRLTETSKEVVVENLAEYLSDAAELENHALFTRLKTQTESVLNSFFEKEKKSISQSGLQYEGYYFLNGKDSADQKDGQEKYNKIYMVYSATVKTADKKYNAFSPTKVYFPVGFQNIVKGTDGDMTTNLNEYDRKGGVSLGYQFMEGYTDLTSMKHALVVTEAVHYQGTSGGNLREKDEVQQ